MYDKALDEGRPRFGVLSWVILGKSICGLIMHEYAHLRFFVSLCCFVALGGCIIEHNIMIIRKIYKKSYIYASLYFMCVCVFPPQEER